MAGFLFSPNRCCMARKGKRKLAKSAKSSEKRASAKKVPKKNVKKAKKSERGGKFWVSFFFKMASEKTAT